MDIAYAVPAHKLCARCHDPAPPDAGRLGPRAWTLSPIEADDGTTVMLAFCPGCSPMHLPSTDRVLFEEWSTGTGAWRRKP